MKFFSKTKNVAKRAIAFESLKEETLLIKNSAKLFTDNLKEIKNNKAKSTESAQKFSDLNLEDVAHSKKIYNQMLALFSILTAAGVIYFLYALANQHWVLATSVIFFIIICGSFCFRFHFYLSIIKTQNLSLSFRQYISLLLKTASKTTPQ